jgi:REP-associated tyrosine transposase
MPVPQLSLFAKKRRRRRPAPAVKPKGKRHVMRPVFSPRHPLHVTYSVVDGVHLRRRVTYQAVKRALRNCCAREGFRICHYSVQGNHIHLIVEADDRRILSRGMQGFGISCAKQINRALGRRKGQVFAGRYDATEIRHPKQVRNTLAYVLNNWRKHGTQGDVPRYVETDPCSSADYFDGWERRPRLREPLALGRVAVRWRGHDSDRRRADADEVDMRPLVAAPRSTFLARDWRRYGLVGTREMPRGD